jgi:hypothetical protein
MSEMRKKAKSESAPLNDEGCGTQEINLKRHSKVEGAQPGVAVPLKDSQVADCFQNCGDVRCRFAGRVKNSGWDPYPPAGMCVR